LRQEISDPIHPDQRRGNVYLNPRYEAAQQELYRRGCDLMQTPGCASQAADEYLQRMADLLAYALMCEERAGEWAHYRDAEKALFAERFYERAFIANIRPNLDAPLLQKEFARVVEGRGFDAGYFTNSTAAKTTPTTTSDTAPIRT
jgi:hypothetical protein